MSGGAGGRRTVDFARVAAAALARAPDLLARWLPDGRLVGREWIARNPRRADGRPGSFRVNVDTGLWSDFATGDRGGDLVSLAAFLFALRQPEAAEKVAQAVAIDPYVGGRG